MRQLLILIVAAGCAPVAVDIPLDLDGDGLLSDQEEALGTDPDRADSDGDGYADGEELELGTDPTDGFSHPYLGGWPVDDCNDTLSPTGNDNGQVTDDFELRDQFGDTVSLHDFCGHTVLMVSSAEWCGPCNTEAPEVQRFYDNLKDQGFLPVTLLGENGSSQTPSTEDLQRWADVHGLTHPVLADEGFAVSARYVDGGSIALPTMHLIGPGGVVLERDARLSESDVASYLE